MVVSSLNGCYINSMSAVTTLAESDLANSNMRWTSTPQTPATTGQTSCHLNFDSNGQQSQSPIRNIDDSGCYVSSENGLDQNNRTGTYCSPRETSRSSSYEDNSVANSVADNVGDRLQLFPITGAGNDVIDRRSQSNVLDRHSDNNTMVATMSDYSDDNDNDDSCSQASPSSSTYYYSSNNNNNNEEDDDSYSDRRTSADGSITTTTTTMRTLHNGTTTKVKIHKCRNCGFTTTDKHESWIHIAIHMKPEKILRCPDCPFVTEYKHHLDFHVWNHQGMKPYKCDKCPYVCVNKSMLKSHSKSHSNVYQYRCANCAYRTKYCHSLKIHLRKYRHEPGLVLDSEGQPNPNPVIDVYGNRRGPKQRSKKNTNHQSRTESSSTGSTNTTGNNNLTNNNASAELLIAEIQNRLPIPDHQLNIYHQNFPPWINGIFLDNTNPSTIVQRQLTASTIPRNHNHYHQHPSILNQLLPSTGVLDVGVKLEEFPNTTNTNTNTTTVTNATTSSYSSPDEEEDECKTNENNINNNNNNFVFGNSLNNNDIGQLNLQSCFVKEIVGSRLNKIDNPYSSSTSYEQQPSLLLSRSNENISSTVIAGKNFDCAPLNLSLTGGISNITATYTTNTDRRSSHYETTITNTNTNSNNNSNASSSDNDNRNVKNHRRKGIACKLNRNYIADREHELTTKPSESAHFGSAQQHRQYVQSGAVGEDPAEGSSTSTVIDSDDERIDNVKSTSPRPPSNPGNVDGSKQPPSNNNKNNNNSNNNNNNNNGSQHRTVEPESREDVKPCFYCKHCEITFFNQVMFTMHMGYHGFADPFTCNRCGKKTENNIGFYAHMITAPHS